MATPSHIDLIEDTIERCSNLDAPLADRLQSFADEARRMDSSFADAVDRMIVRLKASGVGANAPRPGDVMPAFMLPDQGGRLVSLADLLAQGPAVIAFHRGHWCPYCRITADALGRVHAQIAANGAELVVITPEVERFNAELRAAARASYRVLSDIDNSYALLLNLAFYVGDEKKILMQDSGLDLTPYNGSAGWTLPIPATFVVGRDGLIKVRHIDPDFRRRMDTDAIVAAVAELHR